MGRPRKTAKVRAAGRGRKGFGSSSMDCATYRKLHGTFTDFPLPGEVWETQEYTEWVEHMNRCRSCGDWRMEQELARRGVSADDFPCVHMAYHTMFACDEHPEPSHCPDSLVLRIPKFDEYCISPRGSTGGFVSITHCPWCGIKLPQSKRDLWFERIQALGLDPWEDEVPEEFQTDAWFKDAKKRLP